MKDVLLCIEEDLNSLSESRMLMKLITALDTKRASEHIYVVIENKRDYARHKCTMFEGVFISQVW